MEAQVMREALKRTPTYANVGYVIFRLLLNPSDITPTFRLRDLTDLRGFELCMAKVRSDPATAAIIRDRYLSGPHDLEALARMPEGSLGHTHARFMKHFQIPVVFYPDELAQQAQRGAISDENYLRMRARETHDVWHTVLGIPPDGFGEMEIATVYLKQMNLPLSGVLLAVGFLFMTLRMPHGYQDLVESLIKGWTFGGQSKPLIGMRWEEMWERPIADVRKELGLDVTCEAWDVQPMAKLEQASLERFAAYASGQRPLGYDAPSRRRFLPSAILG